MKLRRVGLIPALLACILSIPISSLAQTPAKAHRIASLMIYDVGAWRESALNWKPLLAGLADLGYVEGQNLVFEARNAGGKADRLPDAAAELVALRPEVIVVPICGAPLNALRRATSTIPIVVATCTEDMVATGVVASLAHPGGNVTGQQKLAPELAVKRLELLKQMLPRASRITVLWNAGYADMTQDWRALRSAAEALHVTLVPFEAQSPSEYEPAFAAMASQRVDALFTFTDAMGYQYAQRLADLAAQHRLPAIYPFRETAQAGGLFSFGPSVPGMFRSAAVYVDKILKGAKPADLPVQQPTTFELVINLKTAKSLGLTIPQTLRLRADEMIE